MLAERVARELRGRLAFSYAGHDNLGSRYGLRGSSRLRSVQAQIQALDDRTPVLDLGFPELVELLGGGSHRDRTELPDALRDARVVHGLDRFLLELAHDFAGRARACEE